MCVLEMINRRAKNYKTGDLIRYLYSGYVPEKYGIIVAKKIIDGVNPRARNITFFTVMSPDGVQVISSEDGWNIDKLN